MPVQLILPRRFEDGRGWFSETYNRSCLLSLGIEDSFVQDNHSLSRAVGTVRGLHFQTGEHAQAKLVRCVRGRIWDVAVDVRKGSPTWMRWVAAELGAERGEQLYVPVGFAHGFVTLEPDTEVIYKVSAPYAAHVDAGLAWNDPELGLPWPVPASSITVSEKDAKLPTLATFESPFGYDGTPLGPLEAKVL